MGERPDQIERQITATRSELSENISQLQDKVKSTVDWRTQFQEHPGTLLAVAFGGGVVLSALLPSPHRFRANESSSSRDRDWARPPHEPNDLRKTIEALTGALLGVAVNQASGFLDSLLPGFHQEFTKAKDKDSRDSRTEAEYVTNSSPRPLAAKASA
jgi:hypothetical protein